MATKTLRKVILTGEKAVKVYSKPGQADQIFSMTVSDYNALELPGAGAPVKPISLDSTWGWKFSERKWQFNTASEEMEPGDITDEWFNRGGPIVFKDIGGKDFSLTKGKYTITGTLPNITVVGNIQDTKQSSKTYKITSGVLEEL